MRFEKETNLYQDAAIANKFSSQDTQFNVVNGKISYLISDSDIEEYEDKSKTVTSRLNSSEDSIDRHSQQISSLQTDIVGINGDIDTFKSEVNTFEQTTNSTISSITSTVATKTQVWTVQPTVPYLANDFWIRDNVLYVCTVSRAIGSFNNADWKPATKGRIFTSTPTTPYYSGDVYVQGNSGDILFCSATRLTGNYTASDWSKASKYTDDSVFNNWTQNTYNSFIEQLPSQINLQVTGSREIDANTKYTSKASIIATINDQTFESGVRINADRITLDGDATINAINGSTGNVVVNANKVNLNAYATFTALQTAGATTINGANIETGTITADNIASGTITADNIASNTITANQIASETITSNEIASGTITADQIAAKTITSDEIATGTITANEIATGTITADNIASGTITADKLDVNYLTASDVGDEGSTVISGSRITTGSINADLIKAGTLQSQDNVNYPNFSINLTDGTINIKKGGINLGNGSFVVDNDGNVTMKRGSITIGSNDDFKVDKYGNVIMKSATITGYLKPADIGDDGSTTISGNRIQTGTISAERLDLSGVLKVGALNNYPTKDNLKTLNGTTINGGNITTGTINAERLDLSGVLKVGALNNYPTKTDLKTSGSTVINGGNISTGTISASRLELTNYPTKTDLKTSGSTTINGGNITTGTISASRLDLSGVLKVGALDNYPSRYDLSNGSTSIAGGCIRTGVIKSDSYGDNGTVFNLNTGTITLKKGEINIADKFKVTTNGYVTAKKCTVDSDETGYRVQITSNSINVNKDNTILSRFYSTYPNSSFDKVSVLETYTKSNSVLYINCGVFTDSPNNPKGITVSNGGVKVTGNFYVTGTFSDKGKLIETKDYSERVLYCYETTTPYFGDIGEAVICEDGYCYIMIDPVFSETINTDYYQVFIQKYGNGECYVYSRTKIYFVICGTPGLKFGWEIKCKQINTGDRRLENNEIAITNPSNPVSYNADFEQHMKQINIDRNLI